VTYNEKATYVEKYHDYSTVTYNFYGDYYENYNAASSETTNSDDDEITLVSKYQNLGYDELANDANCYYAEGYGFVCYDSDI